MSPGDTQGADLQALLAHVQAQRDQRIAQIREDCARRCEEWLQRTAAQAREELRDAKQIERRRVAAAVSAARAAGRGRLRRRRQSERARLLHSLWPALDEALRRRWSRPDARQAWIAMALAEGRQRLWVRHWRVEHDGDRLDADELRGQIDHWAERSAKLEIRLAAVEDLGPGLRICSEAAVLDATIDGLLAQRARVEGLLLHLLSERLNRVAEGVQ